MERKRTLADDTGASTSWTGQSESPAKRWSERKEDVEDESESLGGKRPHGGESGESTAGPEVIPKRPRESQDQSHGDLDQLEQKRRKEEDFKILHSAIEFGDFKTVRSIVGNQKEGESFLFRGTSALFKAFSVMNHEMISFLINKGAYFEGSEEESLYDLDIDLERVNHLLLQYNERSGRSCIYRFIISSKSPQFLDRERMNALMTMYKYLFQYEITKSLMEVLENEFLEVVFDFESDEVYRTHHQLKEKFFGLSISDSKEIFIGAKNLLSVNPHKKAKVYGKVAEELCHLAMTIIFKNEGKPYSVEDSNLMKEFQTIASSVSSLIVHSSHIESAIVEVFTSYDKSDWECELIARVPYLIGIYGEDLGRNIFQEDPKLCKLFDFYEDNVLPNCRQREESSLNTESSAEGFKDLHSAIEQGDQETARRIVDDHAQERHFSYDNTSALYKAFQCKNYEMTSYLIDIGAKFVGNKDENDLEVDLDLVNRLLSDYKRRSERSCVYRLMSLSRSPQALDSERRNAIMSMYEHFFRCDTLRNLMKILANVDFDIVFDFKSDKVNMIHRLSVYEAEIFRATLTNSWEIIIGANNLLSGNPQMSGQVHGLVAEELCHMALTIVFENDAKPYGRGDYNLIREFQNIVTAVQSLTDRTSHIESVIADVFRCYPGHEWECELIARVPHVLGIYGEECGRRIFQEYSELQSLLTFYDQNVLPKCTEYTEQSLNTKSHRITKELLRRNEFISFREKGISPLKEDFPSFRDCAVVEEGIYVISTNCIKLCALQVYHELKPVYGEQLERECLFFDRECFEKKRDEILNALKCKLCDYLVLIVDDKELHHQRLEWEYLDYFKEFESEGIKVIIISNSQFLGPGFEEKLLEYQWRDLTDEYKDFRTLPAEYIFKGERKDIFIQKEIVPELFGEEDVLKIISGDLIEVHDGTDLYSQGYNPETYVERQFRATTIDRQFFEKIPPDTCIFINGLNRWEFEELTDADTDERLVQWLEGPDDEIQKGKTIFINDEHSRMNFKHFAGKAPSKNIMRLQYNRKVFYLMNSVGDVCKQREKPLRLTEEEMIELLKSIKTLIISESSGCGKSTVMSSLISHVKKTIYNSWVFRVDLNKFWIWKILEDEGHDSEENHEEDVFKDIYVMLGFKNGIEKRRFREIRNQEDCFIFLDAFDEIPSKHKSKALKLISFLREKTEARVMITTRRHHQQELEEILNAFSTQLVPFDKASQVNCLERLWKWKLKFPNGERRLMNMKEKKAISRNIERFIKRLEKQNTDSESRGLILAFEALNLEDNMDSVIAKIDSMDFKRLAESILTKILLNEDKEFMGNPLHLLMFGAIYFDRDFEVGIQSDIYSIYCTFIEQKILICVEEKYGMIHDGVMKDRTRSKLRKKAYRLHVRLAAQLLQDEKSEVDMSEDDFELCNSLGIAFVRGRKFKFANKSFENFFKAESIRLQLNKDVLMKILFDVKYEEVIKFLYNALASKNFENLTKKFFENFDFLVEVLKKFVLEIVSFNYMYHNYNLNVDIFRVTFIVKSLLKMFHGSIDVDLFNGFTVKLESTILSLANWYCIGGCVPIEMLKMLLSRNFMIYQNMILGMVRYSVNPEDVIDILNEYISIEKHQRCPSENEAGGNVEEDSPSLLRLFAIKDENGKGLLHYGLWNERLEIFANILQYSRRVLGEEQFSIAIIQGTEYRKAMDTFLENVDKDKMIVLLKTLRTVFGDEIKKLFDMGLKGKIVQKALNLKFDFRYLF